MKPLLAIATLLATTGLLATAEPPAGPARLSDVRRGMTMDDVKQTLGAPKHITREILFRRYVEEWHYDEPAGWVEFNCVRGELAYVLNVHAEVNRR